MKKRNVSLAILCTAAVLVSGAGYFAYTKYEQAQERRKQCQVLGPYWGKDVEFVSLWIRQMIPPSQEAALRNPKNAHPSVLEVAKEEFEQSVSSASKVDRELSAGMPYQELYLAVRDKMRERYYEFAKFEEKVTPYGIVPDELRKVAVTQAIQMGTEICKTID